MNKKTFNKIFYLFKVSNIDSENAWNIFLKLLKMMNRGNKDTIEYLTELSMMSQKEKLDWRMKLAEKGIELTPVEIDDYILIICLAINTSWKQHQL